MNKIFKIVAFISFALFLFFAFIGIRQAELSAQLKNVFYLIVSAMPILCGFSAYKIFGFKSSRGKTMLFLSLGFLFFFFGECLWSFYQIVLNQYPFPSIADIFYLLAYPFLFVGLFVEFRNNLFGVKDWRKISFLLQGLFLIIVVSYFGIFLAYLNEGTTLENIVNIAYGVADVFVVLVYLGALLAMREYKGGKIFYPWYAFFTSFLIMMTADVFFAIFNEQYEINALFAGALDTLWLVSYLAFAHGACKMQKIAREAQEKISSQIKNN